MGIDYYSCEVCGDSFPDVIDYGYCSNCEEVLCGDCRDAMGQKYGVLGEDHEKADDFGEEAPEHCDSCYKPERIKYHTVVVSGTYRHYKNKKKYKVIETATHTESEEYLVIYYCLDDLYGEHKMFARPKEMFEEGLTIENQTVPRFELLSPKLKSD
ncbi:DUF1653 domain-containing protein [Alkalihalophilus pseudofirmus]|uniref:DUF1653 domain-containing protein n=1 Tax=Alkalihalophilus pseudofirmus TaxID=79885 RepID=UPI00259B4A3D|nr:DUF1653 domain-containing protein [Alkalihalophilus pseudofirmus]WEG18647.1 DUF1653 domain-containing protein [Alkalihalophilus pseudofirmus]